MLLLAMVPQIGLPTELTTGTCYLQYYVEYILAVQEKYGDGKRLPLCIMTSGDTNDRTLQLLQQHQYFGMDPSQVTLVQQGQGVPALVDNTAAFEVHPDDPYRVVTKPHGHGDVHELLHRHGVAHKWSTELQLKWLVLFQDTNGLAFHTLPLMLGVSRNLNLIMNSLAVPRQAKQAIGGIAKLTHQVTGETRYVPGLYRNGCSVTKRFKMEPAPARKTRKLFTTSLRIARVDEKRYHFCESEHADALGWSLN